MYYISVSVSICYKIHYQSVVNNLFSSWYCGLTMWAECSWAVFTWYWLVSLKSLHCTGISDWYHRTFEGVWQSGAAGGGPESCPIHYPDGQPRLIHLRFPRAARGKTTRLRILTLSLQLCSIARNKFQSQLRLKMGIESHTPLWWEEL